MMERCAWCAMWATSAFSGVQVSLTWQCVTRSQAEDLASVAEEGDGGDSDSSDDNCNIWGCDTRCGLASLCSL